MVRRSSVHFMGLNFGSSADNCNLTKPEVLKSSFPKWQPNLLVFIKIHNSAHIKKEYHPHYLEGKYLQICLRLFCCAHLIGKQCWFWFSLNWPFASQQSRCSPASATTKKNIFSWHSEEAEVFRTKNIKSLKIFRAYDALKSASHLITTQIKTPEYPHLAFFSNLLK